MYKLLILLSFLSCAVNTADVPKNGNISDHKLRVYKAVGLDGMISSQVREIRHLLLSCEDFKTMFPQYHNNLRTYNKVLHVFYVNGVNPYICGQYFFGPVIDTIEVYSNFIADREPEDHCSILKTTAHELLHAAGMMHVTDKDHKDFDNLVDNCVYKRWNN